MSLTGKKELLSTIEQQKEKIAKYESKISDLVRAYKSLSKEKEALQLSLAALSHSSDKSNDSHEQIETTQSQDNPSEDKDDAEAQCSEIASLKNKIVTLAATLQTLTDEKNKLELSTKNERIRILEEKKQVEKQLVQSSDELAKLKKEYEAKLHDLRSKVIVVQHEREKETTNGIMMLREVENRLAKERNEKEKLEKLLDETQEQNRQFALALGTRSQEKKQQKQIIDLQNELEQVRCRLKKAEEQCSEPPMLKVLQEQMEQMRSQYMEAILQEQNRAEAAESSVRSLSQTHEERVAALEASLAELSVTAATYDKRKQKYKDTIHLLKERIVELSEENRHLHSSSNISEISITRTDDEKADAKTLAKELISIWGQLTRLEKFSEGDFEVEELLSNSEVIHQSCFEQRKSLEKTIDELKKSKLFKEEEDTCRCGLKEQIGELRNRIRSMNVAHQTSENVHGRQVSSLKEEIKVLYLTHQENMKHLKQDHKVTVANLEQQLSEHCQRSLMTLQERDEEIHRLSKEIFKLNKEAELQPSTVAAALLSQVGSGGADGPFLHHLEDLARKEIEVSSLRKEKIQLEKSMRDIQVTMIEKQQIMHETIEDLTEEVGRLKRNCSREGENLEYLKNVVLQYMTCMDGEARLVILNAIAAVLKFTPEETDSVKKCLALWWWQAPDKRKHSHRTRTTSFSSFTPTTSSDSSSYNKRGQNRLSSVGY